jgi:hypothetical protein
MVVFRDISFTTYIALLEFALSQTSRWVDQPRFPTAKHSSIVSAVNNRGLSFNSTTAGKPVER